MNRLTSLLRQSAVVVSTLSASACLLPPDVVAEYTPGGESGQPAPRSCEGDCPCFGEQCTQYCSAAPEGPCGFECAPGATCDQICAAESCISECVDAEHCGLSCLQSEGCQITCLRTASCSTQCVSGCTGYCELSDSCDMDCPGGGCVLHCKDSESCGIIGCPFGCTLICEGVGVCQLDCADPATCAVIIR